MAELKGTNPVNRAERRPIKAQPESMRAVTRLQLVGDQDARLGDILYEVNGQQRCDGLECYEI